MTSDVVLTSALRTNLLSLQRTQSLIDDTQLRLATGLKVNSALDNPSNFFAAEGLRDRASDLSRLLDGIGQSIQTIQTADEGIQSLTTLVEQAESLATQARDANASAASSASIAGNVDLTGFTVQTANNGDTLTFSIVDQDGDTTQFNRSNPTTTGASDTYAITLATGDTIESIVNDINLVATQNGSEDIFNAQINSSGQLEIATTNGYSFNLSIDGGTSDADSTALASVLGFGDVVRSENTASGSSVGVTARAAAVVTTQALFTNTTANNGVIASRSTALDGLFRDKDGDGTVETAEVAFNETNLDASGTDSLSINIGLNGTTARSIDVDASTTIQELVDGINADSVLQNKIEASYNETTGQLALAALDSSTESIEISATIVDQDLNGGADDADVTLVFDLGFGVVSANPNAGALSSGADGTANPGDVTATTSTDTESIRLSGGGGDLAQFQSDFNKTIEQIDQLVADTNYRGTNLLQGDTLNTTFNEDGTSTLTTTGADLTSSGLGISTASFISDSEIQASIDEADAALDTVRNFSSSLAGDLVIIQTRQEFTENLINNLQEGADDLTLADENEEGANLLSLQTRQTLGVTSLSLASQSQQSVLRLF